MYTLKVIPEQVESVLCSCPGILEAVVSGIDDTLRGQRVCAWVVRDDSSFLATDILVFCRRELQQHECPQKIVFVNQLPLSTSGKIDILRLKQETLMCIVYIAK